MGNGEQKASERLPAGWWAAEAHVRGAEGSLKQSSLSCDTSGEGGRACRVRVVRAPAARHKRVRCDADLSGGHGAQTSLQGGQSR